MPGLYLKTGSGWPPDSIKNGLYLQSLETLGFGFIEIGTITPLPQSGNPKPRLFRLKKDEALINRMGFNNHGVDKVAARLKNGQVKMQPRETESANWRVTSGKIRIRPTKAPGRIMQSVLKSYFLT